MSRRKPCLDCGGDKGPGKGHRWCEPCMSARQTKRRHRGRGVRGGMLKTRYGITVETYDEMLRNQQGVCAICKQDPPNGRLLRFSVDHDHATEEIRGLLCQRCNMALHFLENLEWRASAERYLANPPALQCKPLLAAEQVNA